MVCLVVLGDNGHTGSVVFRTVEPITNIANYCSKRTLSYYYSGRIAATQQISFLFIEKLRITC